MTEFTPIAGLIGGLLIGLSALTLMGAYGRIAGLSGIFAGLLTLNPGAEFSWRAIFVAGLLIGAGVMGLAYPQDLTFSGSFGLTAVGGLIVGAGTVLGGGCTSGHGICGLSRLSLRSLIATVTFMAVAVATVFVTRHMLGT